MKNKRKHLKDNLIRHPRRNMWGEVILPGKAYANFKYNKGLYHPNYTWRMRCAEYRKRIRKNRIAKESRRRNRR